LLKTFDHRTRVSGIAFLRLSDHTFSEVTLLPEADPAIQDYLINFLTSAAGNVSDILYTKENFASPPDLYHASIDFDTGKAMERKLSAINPQQAEYNWGTAELVHWTAYNGKEAVGILHKPEDFDPLKTYPMICRYYEELGDPPHHE